MLKNIWNRIKNVVLGLMRSSTKQLEIILMNTLFSLFSKGMYFFAFYFVFMFNPESSRETNISMVIIIGFLVWLWSMLTETLKDWMMQNVTPYKGSIFRWLFNIRYTCLVAVIFFLFNLKYTQNQFYIYFAIIVLSQLLAQLCVARKITILGKDWKQYYEERK